jgi:hypothetical protein
LIETVYFVAARADGKWLSFLQYDLAAQVMFSPTGIQISIA